MHTKGREYLTGWCRGEDVCLVYRDNKQKHVQQAFVPWYFLVRTIDFQKSPVFGTLKGLIREARVWFHNKNYTQIFCENKNLSKTKIVSGERDAKMFILEELRRAGVQTFEADLSSLKRLMIDQEVVIASSYKTIFLDLETQDALSDGRKLPLKVGAYPILSASVEFKNGVQNFLCHRQEQRVLHDILKFLEATDVVVTFNGKMFDIPYLRERFDKYDIFFDWRTISHVDMFEQLFDLHKFDQEVEQFSLDYLSSHFLENEKKIPHVGKTIYQMWTEQLAGASDLLRQYNLQDTRLIRLINEQERILPFMIQLCRATGCFLSEYHKSWLIDSFILKLGAMEGRPLKTKEKGEKEGKFDGAYVMDPIPGRYRGVDVFDYESLYPNIIRSWNIGTDDDSMLAGEDLERAQMGIGITDWDSGSYSRSCTPHDEVYYAQDHVSLLAKAVALFLDGRAEVRARLKEIEKTVGKDSVEWKNLDLLQNVWKILANSTYGITASPLTRFFDKRIAESITHGGRVCLELGKRWFDRTFKTIYGDTDSLFVLLNGAKPVDLLPAFHADLHKWLKDEWGVQKPTIKTKHEKHYRSLTIVGKKHYAGFTDKGKKGCPGCGGSGTHMDGIFCECSFSGKGLDHKKRMTSPIARRLLNELWYDLNRHEKPVEHYDAWIAKIQKKLLRSSFTNEFIFENFTIQKKVNQGVSEYKEGKALPIHVAIYEDLENAGHEVWMPYVVRYVAVIPDGTRQGTEDGIAVQMFAESGRELDRAYYWNTEILGKLIRVLEAVFPEHDWMKWNTTMAEKRAKYIEAFRSKLEAPETFFKALAALEDSVLSTEQRQQVKAEIPAHLYKLRELELARYVEKKMEKWVDPKAVAVVCRTCSPETPVPQHRGRKVGRIHSYDQQICTKCGHEIKTQLL